MILFVFLTLFWVKHPILNLERLFGREYFVVMSAESVSIELMGILCENGFIWYG